MTAEAAGLVPCGNTPDAMPIRTLKPKGEKERETLYVKVLLASTHRHDQLMTWESLSSSGP